LRTLALDLSTKTGWALFEGDKLIESGSIPQVKIEDFNVNADPNFSPHYPWNMMKGAATLAANVTDLVWLKEPGYIVTENTVKGRNRHTQRILEWIHLEVLRLLCSRPYFSDITHRFSYMDPSEWRKIVDMRLSNEQKKNNRDVSAGKKRGRIGKKHLSVAMANEKFNLKLKLKDNDQADAILLGLAFVTRKSMEISKQ
jgi:hypothetical protein